MPSRIFFLSFFLKAFNLILNIQHYYCIQSDEAIFFRKYKTPFSKKQNKNKQETSSWLVDIVFEICLDNKFHVREEIFKNVYQDRGIPLIFLKCSLR